MRKCDHRVPTSDGRTMQLSVWGDTATSARRICNTHVTDENQCPAGMRGRAAPLSGYCPLAAQQGCACLQDNCVLEGLEQLQPFYFFGHLAPA
jgi:hypothetical protein